MPINVENIIIQKEICITDCKVVHVGVNTDKNQMQKKMTANSDDASEYVFYTNERNNSTIKYYPSGTQMIDLDHIFQIKVPNKAVIEDKIVFETEPMSNDKGTTSETISLTCNELKINTVAPNMRNPQTGVFASMYYDPNGASSFESYLDFKLQINNNGGEVINTKTNTFKVWVDDMFISTTKLTESRELSDRMTASFSVRCTDKAIINKLVAKGFDNIVYKIAESNELLTVDNFKIGVSGLTGSGETTCKVAYNGKEYSGTFGRNNPAPLTFCYGTKEYTTDVVVKFKSTESMGDQIVFPFSTNKDGSTNEPEYGVYITKSGTEDGFNVYTIKKEWIQKIVNIVPMFNYNRSGHIIRNYILHDNIGGGGDK